MQNEERYVNSVGTEDGDSSDVVADRCSLSTDSSPDQTSDSVITSDQTSDSLITADQTSDCLITSDQTSSACLTTSDYSGHYKGVSVEWMKLYRACKYGEEYEGLEKVSHRDLAVWIESGKSALDVAAYYGQVEVVKTMIGTMMTGDEEWAWSLMSALNWACQGSRVDVVRYITGQLNCPMLSHRSLYSPLSDDRFHNLYQIAATVSEPQVLVLLEDLLPDVDWKRHSAIATAFFHGRKATFLHLVNKLDMRAERLAVALSVPLVFVLIALGRVDDVSRELENNKNWYHSRILTMDSSTMSVEINAFIMGAKFFNESIMDVILVHSKKIVDDERFKWESVWMCVYTAAISVDDYNVLEWLEKHQLAVIKPGYEMDLHQQCLIKPYGTIFQRLKERFPVPCSSREMTEKMMLACFSTCYRGYTDLALYYLGLVTHVYDSEYTQYCLKVAIFSETPDIVETLLDLVDLSCDHTSGILHEALRWGLQCKQSRNKRLPSPAMIELLLNRLPRGSSCECCECILFDLFFDYEEYDEGDSHNRERALLTYACVVDHVKIIISQFINHGAKPRLDAIRNLFTRFFTSDSPRSYFAARLLWIADWYDLSELNLDTNKYPLWFLSSYEDRDVFLAHFLQSMSGNKRRTIRWDGLLVYILKPDTRRRQMKICIQETGLIIEDEMFKRLPPEIQRTEAYKDVMTLTKGCVISLLSLSRLCLLKYLRVKCTENRKRGRGDFLPLYSFNQLWCEKRKVPHMLCHYFEFCDVFHQWNYELGPKIHNDFTDTMEDVFVQFHLDRALNDQ